MKSNNPQLTNKRYIVLFVLITSVFFLWGFSRAILDVLNKHFQNTLDITITQSAWIKVTTYLGYFLMAIPAGLFINKFGYRRGVVFGLLLFGGGIAVHSQCRDRSVLCLFGCVVCHRLRFGVLGDGCQSLRHGAWSSANSDQ